MRKAFLILTFSIFFYSLLQAQTTHPEVYEVRSALQGERINLTDIYITDHYESRGITHTYFKQAINGIPIYNISGGIHYKYASDKIVQFEERQFDRTGLLSIPTLSPIEAIRLVLRKEYLTTDVPINLVAKTNDPEQMQEYHAPEISGMPLTVKLQYFLTKRNQVRLVWEFPIEDLNTGWMTDYFVDAETGKIHQEVDWTVECNHTDVEKHDHTCTETVVANDYKTHKKANASVVANSYTVYAWPVESPNHGVRSVETAPWLDNATASPNGWHTIGATNYTVTTGNNTDTYLDDDNTNNATGGDAARADGGATLDFAFPLDVSMNPSLYKEAALTNTFYWSNLMHDVWYNYGFDEASGNFQQENYTANGAGTDYVRSEVQDASGNCNANFGTPPDGSRPRMQMFLCNRNGLIRDGDYDNGVIAHEYGHGISNRLTGGPAASGCLGNAEQMGEGWSDYLGMVMTIETGDSGPDSRGMGTWLFAQAANGPGIRPFPYSTDFAVNPMTYASSFSGVSQPHGIGSVWATMLWDMTWSLIDVYGFDSDIYNGTGGNNIAMELVLEGMKLQPCSPGFVDGRDAILEADRLLNGGVNEAYIWNAFAKRGLGFSADQGSSSNRSDGSEAFDLPAELTKTSNLNDVEVGTTITYAIKLENKYQVYAIDNYTLTDTIPDELIFISATNGGTESGGVITWPISTLNAGTSTTVEAVFQIDPSINPVTSDFFDNIESGNGNFETSNSGSTAWSIVSTAANSGTNAWFAPNNPTTGQARLDILANIAPTGSSQLSFYHQYDTEATYDGGRVFISTDGGQSFSDLGNQFTSNPYNSTVVGSLGFSGNSGGFINSTIDLSSFADLNVIIRFQMNTDNNTGGNGWWIDDITINNLQVITINEVAVQNSLISNRDNAVSVRIVPAVNALNASVTGSTVTCFGDTDGVANIAATGGSGNYTYLWNDGNTDATRTNLSVGSYQVTITDGSSSVSKSAIVIQPELLEVEFNIDRVTNIDFNNGAAAAIISGGNGGDTYSWSNNETASSISNLVPDTYSVTVTDSKNCTENNSVLVDRYNCGEKFYDSGSNGSNYSNNEDITTVICPSVSGETMTVTFNSFNVEADWDALYVYNGPSITSPIFDSGNPTTDAGFPAGGYYGTSSPGPFTSTSADGCLTFRFRSDQFVTGSGWDIDITCEAAACPDEVTTLADDGFGSLRYIVECNDSGSSITVDPSLAADTIQLSSKIMIDKNLNLTIAAGSIFNIKSNSNDPIFEITNSGSLNLDNVKIHAGQGMNGGAIINNGSLILQDVDIFSNSPSVNANSLIQNTGTVEVQGESNVIQE